MLTRNDMYAAMYLGHLHVEGLKESAMSATSFDVRIEKLFRRVRWHQHDPKKLFEDPEDNEDDYEEVPLVDDEFWLPEPNKLYFFDTKEVFHLAGWYSGSIDSRSSWARYGSAVQTMTDTFKLPHYDGFHGKVRCGLNTLGTLVKIRPGDAIAQAHMCYDGCGPVLDDEMEMLIKQGRLRMTRDGEEIAELMQTYIEDDCAVIRPRSKGKQPVHSEMTLTSDGWNGGFTLTLDRKIKIYTGKVIDPRDPDPDCFEEIELDYEGTVIPAGTFFLSASAEEVEIDRHYVGWVGEFNLITKTKGFGGFGPSGFPSTLQTHAGAPKIDPYPRFRGKITFENLPRVPIKLRPGMRLTELYLRRLNNPYFSEKEERSRYRDQGEATISRGHHDYQSQQLEFYFKR